MLSKLMKKTIISLSMVFIFCSVKGQQGAAYNLYFQDHYYLNPAAAGSNGLTVFNIAAKEFWLGFPENTPGTQSMVFHTRLNKINFNLGHRGYSKKREGRVGLGGMLYNDINGPIRKTGILMSYAYHIRLRDANLSFGLSSYTYQVFTDKEKLTLKNMSDPFLFEHDYLYTTDMNVGIYINSRDYYVSLTSNNISESKLKIKDSDYISTINNREYLLFTGYNFKINPRLDFEPSFLFKTDEDFLTRMDLNTKWTYNKKFWTGIGISTFSSLNFFVGVISEQFDFGYSFQLPSGDIIKYSLGSHEVMFSMKFGQNRFNRYQRFYR